MSHCLALEDPLHVCSQTMNRDFNCGYIHVRMFTGAYNALFSMYIQGVPGGKDLTSGECSLGQTIPI